MLEEKTTKKQNFLAGAAVLSLATMIVKVIGMLDVYKRQGVCRQSSVPATGSMRPSRRRSTNSAAAARCSSI